MRQEGLTLRRSNLDSDRIPRPRGGDSADDMGARDQHVSRIVDLSTVEEPTNGAVRGPARCPESDCGVTRVDSGGNLVAVARARGDDLELAGAAFRRRLDRRRLIRRPLLLRPL